MLGRYRIAGTAFGLTLLASGVLAQEDQSEAAAEQNQGAERQSELSFPVPLPVEIAEDPAEQEARRAQEREAQQLQTDDLAAQRGMQVASDRMANAADAQTFWIAAGTVLLFIALFLSARANMHSAKAAQAAADAAKYQRTGARPVLHPINYFLRIDDNRDGGALISFCADIENIGGGPAFLDGYAVDYAIRNFGTKGGIDVSQLEETEIGGRCFIRADAIRNWRQRKDDEERAVPFLCTDIPLDDWAKVSGKRAELLIAGYFAFRDSYGFRWLSGFGFVYWPDWPDGENLAQIPENAFWFDREAPAKDQA